MSGHLNYTPLKEFSAELIAADYEPDQVIRHYTIQYSNNGIWNWFKDDWRGRRGDKPELIHIRKTISGAVHHKAIPPPAPKPAKQPTIPASAEGGFF